MAIPATQETPDNLPFDDTVEAVRPPLDGVVANDAHEEVRSNAPSHGNGKFAEKTALPSAPGRHRGLVASVPATPDALARAAALRTSEAATQPELPLPPVLPNQMDEARAIPPSKEPSALKSDRPEGGKSSAAPEPALTARKHARHSIELDVSLYSDNNFYSGFTENLSAGGIFVATHCPRPLGEMLELTITLPPDQSVKVRGVVRWLRQYNEASNTKPGMGIEFIDVENSIALDEFLNARSPLFYDDEL